MKDSEDTLPEEVKAAINERSMHLIEEFSDHFKRVAPTLPQPVDEHRLFRGWAIQKLASLQLLVESLYDRVGELGG